MYSSATLFSRLNRIAAWVERQPVGTTPTALAGALNSTGARRFSGTMASHNGSLTGNPTGIPEFRIGLPLILALFYLFVPHLRALDEVGKEELGQNLFALDIVCEGEAEHLLIVEDMRFGHGDGKNLTHWHRSTSNEPWKKRLLFPSHRPGMARMLLLEDRSFLVLYVDREDEENRRVFLQRVSEERTEELFQYSAGRGVLNPQMDLLPNGLLHLLIPDRTSVEVRRFVIDLATRRFERLADIIMPKSGARIYDRLVHDGHLVVPISINNEMQIAFIALDDHQPSLRSVDRFESAGNEPPRMTTAMWLPDRNLYAFVYMRPARFTDRYGAKGPRTGTLGEIVLNLVDQSGHHQRSHILAGHEARRASTHNIATLPLDGPRLLLAHTEVDRVHERVISGEYANYMGGFVTLFELDPQNQLVAPQQLMLPPFFSTHLARRADGTVLLLCNEASPGNPLYLYHLRLQ
jgi:hypothetical protein